MKLPSYFSLFKKSVFLLLLFIFLSILLMNFSEPSSLRGVRWALLQTIEFIDSIKNTLSSYRDLSEENEQLKRENFQLHLTNHKLREMLLENIRLRRMLKLKKESDYNFVTAHVIGRGPEKGINSIMLDIGREDNVFKNMAVVNADGLVGKVISTTKDHSIVQLLADHNSLVSAKLQNSRENGVIAWSGNAWLDLLYIPKNISIEEGELVITSGLSQIYPPGFKIGVVASYTEDEYEMFKTIRIKPSVNFNALEEVFVVREKKPEKGVSE
ncbi:MAG: rod shape-determining protein MreC [Calditrichae bacterium]|nr:rod shape-determining protein MreC [Calditrichia bacterium]